MLPLDDDAHDILIVHDVVHTDGLTWEFGALAPDHGVAEVVLEVAVDQLADIAYGVGPGA